jgi:hypothetical protein
MKNIVLFFAVITLSIRVSAQEEKFADSQAINIGGVTYNMIFVEGNRCYTTFENGEQQNGNDFYIGQTEVTQGLWSAVMGKKYENKKRITIPVGNNYPVVGLTIAEIDTFLTKLNQRTGRTYRLPINVEWSYAFAGGTCKSATIYSGSDNPDEVAWYKNNSDEKIHPIAQKRPNALGIYDMSGNVSELCSDGFTDDEKKSHYWYNLGGNYNEEKDEFAARQKTLGSRWLEFLDSPKIGIRLVCDAGSKTNYVKTRYLAVSTTEISFANKGDKKTISVSTDGSSWNVLNAPSWCTVTKGGGGLIFTLTCSANTGNDRSAVLKVSSGDKEVSITVKQDGKPATYLTVDSKEFAFRSIGEPKSISVNTDGGSWEVEQLPSWCSITKSGNSFTLSCTENKDAARKATIKVTAKPKYTYIDISQTAGATYLNADVSNVKFSASGGFQTISVTTDADSWRVVCPSWCTLQMGNSSFTVSCNSNNNDTPNTGVIKIVSGKIEVQIEATQKISFNTPKGDPRPLGLSLGYVQKQWEWKTDGQTIRYGAWDTPDSYLSGLQVGIRYEPLFKYGLGLSTGLFYEYYQSESGKFTGTYSDASGEYDYRMNFSEHSLHLPLHLEYRLNFSKQFQFFVEAGPSLDYGLGAKLIATEIGESKPFYTGTDIYQNSELGFPNKRFNASIDFGAGIRLNGLQLNVGISRGLLNISANPDVEIRQNKPITASLSWMIPQEDTPINTPRKEDYYQFTPLKQHGLTASYVSKQWEWKQDDYVERFGVFDADNVNGISIGYRYEPYFVYGFGLNTGLNIEYYFGSSDDQYDDYGSYSVMYNEVSLNLPIHLEYRLLFSKLFSIYVETGVSFDLGLYSGMSITQDGQSGETVSGLFGNTEYGFYNKQFVPYFDYGFGIRIKNIQLGFTGCRGLSDYKGDGFSVKQIKLPMLAFAWMFY